MLNDLDEGAAKVGNLETTTELDEYPDHFNPNIVYSDVPGIGTPDLNNFEKYCKKFDVEKFDAFLILSNNRFTIEDLQFAQKAKSLKKPFFFIRAHIKSAISPKKRNTEKKGQKFDEEKELEDIRVGCFEKLKNILASETDIFLIDNYETSKWDFERLIAGITNVLPERRKECFILSLSNLTRNCLKRKAKLLKARAGVLATITAPASALPVPLAGAAIDIALILEEVPYYRSQFNLPQEDSEEFKKLDKELQKLVVGCCIKAGAQFIFNIGATIGIELAAEEAVKYIPGVGMIVGSVLSAAVASKLLFGIIDQMEEIALKIWDKTVGT